MDKAKLLEYLEKASKPCNIKELPRQLVAVDAHSLLIKMVAVCAAQLVRGEEECQMYIDFGLKYVNLLKGHFIKVVMVFDGKKLPIKAKTGTEKYEAPEKAKNRAATLMKLGKADKAALILRNCIELTPDKLSNFIKALHQSDVDCIVAPYEAAAQMAFLNLNGYVDCVITEDPNPVIFGCTKVLFKLDLEGNGRLVMKSDLHLAMNMRPAEFSFEKFRYMCILSGCNYVSNVPGIGLEQAEIFVKLAQQDDPVRFLNKIPRYLNMHHLEITEEYKTQFLIANATFLHQLVYHPSKRKLVYLTNPDSEDIHPDYLVNAGYKCNSFLAFHFACGNLNPDTGERYDYWAPHEDHRNTVWFNAGKINGSERKRVREDDRSEPGPSTSANLKYRFITSSDVTITEVTDCSQEPNPSDERYRTCGVARIIDSSATLTREEPEVIDLIVEVVEVQPQLEFQEEVVEEEVESNANTSSDDVIFVAPFVPIVTVLDSDESGDDLQVPEPKRPRREKTKQPTIYQFFAPVKKQLEE